MRTVTNRELQDIVSQANPTENHPIYRFIQDEDLIASVEGDAEASIRVYRRSGAVMTSEELTAARQKATHIGHAGEELVSQYLEQQREQGAIIDFQWTSSQNAVAPYDFTVTELDGTVYRLDVKTTSGGFDSKFHISRAELLTMAEDPEPYKLFRVFEYNLEDGTGKLKIASDMHEFSAELLQKLRELPDGISVDSISCHPLTLDFANDVYQLPLEQSEEV